MSELEQLFFDYSSEEYESLLSEEQLQDWIFSVLHEVKRDGFGVSISFVSNEEIRELNKNYRGKDNETDVLSFSQIEGEEFDFENRLLGDIVVSVPYALSQAENLGHSLMEEVKYLLLHGTLHLMGYDHDENEEGEMSILEKSIYQKLTGDIVV